VSIPNCGRLNKKSAGIYLWSVRLVRSIIVQRRTECCICSSKSITMSNKHMFQLAAQHTAGTGSVKFTLKIIRSTEFHHSGASHCASKEASILAHSPKCSTGKKRYMWGFFKSRQKHTQIISDFAQGGLCIAPIAHCLVEVSKSSQECSTLPPLTDNYSASRTAYTAPVIEAYKNCNTDTI
jgi:hypothetical protein